MISTTVHAVSAGLRRRWRHVWALDGGAVCAAALLTVIVELGTWGALRLMGLPADRVVLATLAMMVAWVPIAAAAWAVGATGLARCCLRGGEMADASGVALIVFWATGAISFVGAVKLYCILMAVALFACAIVSLSRQINRRVILAGMASVISMVMLASPVWLSGPASTMSQETARPVTVWAVRANAYFAATEAIADRIDFVWIDSGLMYRLTPLGDRLALPRTEWYWPVVMFLPTATAIGASGVLIRRIWPATPPAVS
jgi:hypothetical protein